MNDVKQRRFIKVFISPSGNPYRHVGVQGYTIHSAAFPRSGNNRLMARGKIRYPICRPDNATFLF
jgi:hypothetical protein